MDDTGPVWVCWDVESGLSVVVPSSGLTGTERAHFHCPVLAFKINGMFGLLARPVYSAAQSSHHADMQRQIKVVSVWYNGELFSVTRWRFPTVLWSDAVFPSDTTICREDAYSLLRLCSFLLIHFAGTSEEQWMYCASLFHKWFSFCACLDTSSVKFLPNGLFLMPTNLHVRQVCWLDWSECSCFPIPRIRTMEPASCIHFILTRYDVQLWKATQRLQTLHDTDIPVGFAFTSWLRTPGLNTFFYRMFSGL